MHTYTEGPTLESESGLHCLSINLPFILWPLLSWTHTRIFSPQRHSAWQLAYRKTSSFYVIYYSLQNGHYDLTKPVNCGLLFVYSTEVPSGPLKVERLTGARSAQGSWVPPGIIAGSSALISFSISSAGRLHELQSPVLATLNFINHYVLLHKSVS